MLHAYAWNWFLKKGRFHWKLLVRKWERDKTSTDKTPTRQNANNANNNNKLIKMIDEDRKRRRQLFIYNPMWFRGKDFGFDHNKQINNILAVLLKQTLLLFRNKNIHTMYCDYITQNKHCAQLLSEKPLSYTPTFVLWRSLTFVPRMLFFLRFGFGIWLLREQFVNISKIHP